MACKRDAAVKEVLKTASPQLSPKTELVGEYLGYSMMIKPNNYKKNCESQKGKCRLELMTSIISRTTSASVHRMAPAH